MVPVPCSIIGPPLVRGHVPPLRKLSRSLLRFFLPKYIKVLESVSFFLGGKKSQKIKFYNCAGFDDASQNCPSELFRALLIGTFLTISCLLIVQRHKMA
jgi:hypothetical protein